MVRLAKGVCDVVKAPKVGSRRSARQMAPNLPSNILISSGSKSATGKPLFIGGPQIGFLRPRP